MPGPRSSLVCLALALPLFACHHGPEPSAEGEANWAPEAGAQPVLASVAKIHGLRGVESPQLPEGAFMGEGAPIHADQWISLPRGTRAELLLEGGQRLRVDEGSELRLLEPEAGAGVGAGAGVLKQRVELRRGRLVVLAADEGPVEVHSADDRLVVERGEVELHAAAETRHYGVIQGRAVLHTAGRELPLGPGASISTPAAPSARPETPPDPTILAAALAPTLSLAPLHESAWAAQFEHSAQLAESLPRGVGSLVARRAGSSVERQSLRLTEQRVKVTISGRIARTEIEQAFHNDSSQTLEGIYQMPLPADASISDLQLLVGNSWVRGEMLEKRRAEQIFREIVDATVPRDPALLQWERGGVFKLNIFPIPGKGERRVKLSYTQVLPAVGDALRYRYPMGGSGATATQIGEFSFEVEIDGQSHAASALAQVRSTMAELAQTRAGDGDLSLSMRERDYLPTHELGVDIPLPARADSERVVAATHRDRDGQGYFMLTLEPELELQADPRPVHYAFVLDRSHGTTPELWAAASGLTKATLATLEPEDRYTVLACDSACDQLDGGLRGAAEDPAGSSARLDRFLDEQVLAGASDLGNMLTRADAALGPASAEVERVVVYLGDGSPSSGALTADELGELARRELAGLRVQAVALGARSDLLVLDALVRESGGDLLRADARDDLDALARELRLRAQVPVARDLELELPPGLTQVYPKAIPALRAGDTLTVVGKLAEGDPASLRGDVRLHGRGHAGAVDERFTIMLDAEYSKAGESGVHAHLPRTWAQHEITHLTQTQGADARDRIVALSREYNVMSRFTALLVLENDRMFREFNVARRAEDKHGWDGRLDEAAKDAELSAGEESSEVASRTSSSSSPTSAPVVPAGSQPSFDALAPSERSRDAKSIAFDDLAGGGGIESEEDEAFADEGDGADRDRSGGGKAEKKKSSSKPSAPSKSVDAFGGFDDFGGASGWGGGGGPWGGKQKWRPRMVLRDADRPSAADFARIVDLQAIRDRDPSDRKAHRDLVRRAVRAGDRNTLAFAAAWAQADPDHAPALIAHADALAAAGDPLAARAYASAIEVDPFSARLHRRLADGLRREGDLERSCSHRRALVSLDPSDGRDGAELIECLVEAGRVVEAERALTWSRERVSSSGDRKALERGAAALSEGPRARRDNVHGFPELRAELRWPADAGELEVAFIDHRGRRLSSLNARGVLVREERDGSERVQVMTMRFVDQPVFVEVTRVEDRGEDPIRARLTVKAVDGRKTWELLLEPGSQRVASARWR